METHAPPQQARLTREQLDEFNFDGFVESQHAALRSLLAQHALGLSDRDYIVDVGGGRGYFAKRIGDLHTKVKVYETDPEAIAQCQANGVEAQFGDATRPTVSGNERLICLNLILHHLIGPDEASTRRLQAAALTPWSQQHIFVHEYCYQSFFDSDLSGRIIYFVTGNKLLSRIGKFVSGFVPSLRANTFGVGVRFRSSNEWIRFFEHCGFKTVGVVLGEPERISFPRRLLLIQSIRRDSFLIQFR